MPKPLKLTAIFVFVLAILFFIFIDQGKHIPALANVDVSLTAKLFWLDFET